MAEIEELHQKWLMTGAVEDGHSYVLALWQHAFLANHSPDQMLGEITQGVSVPEPRYDAASYTLDDGGVFGARIVAHQLQGGDHFFNVVEIALDGARYVFLPQRWARSPVRMARLRVTTWPEPWQIGPDAYAHWMARVHLAYGLSDNATMAQKPTGTSAIELDLGELLAPQWRYVLLTADADALRKLLGLFDLLLSVRGTGGGSIDPPVSALRPGELPDRVAQRVGRPSDAFDGVERAGESLQAAGWTYRNEGIDGTTGSRETLSRVSLHLAADRWTFEKRVLWEHADPGVAL